MGYFHSLFQQKSEFPIIEQEANQRAEAERRAAEEQQRTSSRRYIGRGWELER